MPISRRGMLQAGAFGAVAAATAQFRVSEANAQTRTQAAGGASRYQKIFSTLDGFAEQFMRDMNAPGMTLVLADRDGVQRVVTYGFSDLERQQKLQSAELFQIGSITKSFIALVLLQLHDEGKLDFNKPIVDYLPWLRIQSSFAPITAHHLLTHSAGLPSNSDVFPSDPAQRHLAAYAPGQHFHYNNMAYTALGHLAWTLDGRELPEICRRRIFEPLGMSQSEPTITFDMREKMVKSYAPFRPDRPYSRHGRLCEAPGILLTSAAGCIASTARDMGAYIQMIANRGKGPKGALISPGAFELFCGRHIAAEEFGPGASYGYGIAVDTLDGHARLRHTGGMVSFMSALMVDIDEGVGAFASVNAQQGYRPNAVAEYALKLMRAQRTSRILPAMPAGNSPRDVPNAADYAGVFTAGERKLQFLAEGGRLFVLHDGERVVVEKLAEADHFVALHRVLDRFPLIFGRKDAEATKSAVVEVSWGGDWYRNTAYDGPTQFNHPKAWESYVGHYRNENPWTGSLHIVLRKGKLLIDGATPLEAEGDLFRLRGEPFDAEWIRFGEVVNGRCMRLKLSGEDLWRVAAA